VHGLALHSTSYHAYLPRYNILADYPVLLDVPREFDHDDAYMRRRFVSTVVDRSGSAFGTSNPIFGPAHI
jgi:hypothetical protein